MKTKFFYTNQFLVIVFIAILLVWGLFPIYWMALSSVKVDEEIYRISPTWIPQNFTWDHYHELFSQFNFLRHMLNSAIIAISTTVISVLLGLPAAYGFSRYKFLGSNIVLLTLLLIRLFTPAALIVPFYDMMSWMKLIDSPLSIILGVTVINLPFVLWIMKAFFDDFPKELEEAAKVDGGSHFRIFINIVLPCALPAIATVLLFSFTMGWNDFLFGLSFSQTIRSIPATVAISSMISGYKVYWGAMMAGGTVLSIPVVVITLMLQKYFVKGLTLGAIKE